MPVVGSLTTERPEWRGDGVQLSRESTLTSLWVTLVKTTTQQLHLLHIHLVIQKKPMKQTEWLWSITNIWLNIILIIWRKSSLYLLRIGYKFVVLNQILSVILNHVLYLSFTSFLYVHNQTDLMRKHETLKIKRLKVVKNSYLTLIISYSSFTFVFTDYFD